MESNALGYGVSFQGDENVPKLTVVITAYIGKYTQYHGNVHFK